MRIIDQLDNKKVLIWGYGREGKSTENFIKLYCPHTKYEIYEGDKEGFSEEDFDFIIKSPGIPFLTSNPKYISQTSLFLDEFKDQTIAITGTKGKSTTSSLMYHVLESANKKCILVGNIGQPCLDYYSDIDKDTYIVFEISAHQLVSSKTSPHIGAFLNLYEEHLDYYQNMENYFNAKANITRFQNESDYYLFGKDVPSIDTKANKILIDNIRKFDLQLKGDHNQFNANVVYYIAVNILKLDEELVLKSLKEFKNLKHRLDFVGTFGDIDYYDDSISTIPQATISAINSISNVDTIIIGGLDRGINYDILVDYIKNHKYNYIMTYGSGKVIYDKVSGLDYVFYEEDLKKAVDLAKKITQKGKACVLSPASASYDHFKNFEERGNVFVELIKK